MAKLWDWIDGKKINYEWKTRIFIAINCIRFCFWGLIAWLIVSRIALDSFGWALCFVAYPGFFIGYLGGILFLCRQ